MNNQKNQALKQPISVRLVIYLNIIFWGIQLPFFGSNIGPQIAITIFIAFFSGWKSNRIKLSFFISICAFILYSSISFWVGPCVDGNAKVIASIAALTSMLISLNLLAGSVQYEIPLLDIDDAKAILWIISIASAAEYFLKYFNGYSSGNLRVGGVFLEPSHLALSTAPLLFFLWIKREIFYSLLFSTILLTVSYSSTLVILVMTLTSINFIGTLVSKSKVKMIIYSTLVIFSIFLFLFFGSDFLLNSDTAIRIADVVDLRDDSNLSSLVYVNGWQQLFKYFENTYGLGLGLNAMGCTPIADTDVTSILKIMNLGEQNSNDGSFIFSKIVSELGVVGIFIFTSLSIYSIKKLFYLTSKNSDLTIISVCWLAVVAPGGIIRSTSYFSGPIILGILSFFILKNINKDQNKIN